MDGSLDIKELEKEYLELIKKKEEIEEEIEIVKNRLMMEFEIYNLKIQSEKIVLILGEFSRNDVGILRKSTLFLMMKNKTEEMMSYSSGSQHYF